MRLLYDSYTPVELAVTSVGVSHPTTTKCLNCSSLP